MWSAFISFLNGRLTLFILSILAGWESNVCGSTSLNTALLLYTGSGGSGREIVDNEGGDGIEAGGGLGGGGGGRFTGGLFGGGGGVTIAGDGVSSRGAREGEEGGVFVTCFLFSVEFFGIFVLGCMNEL